MTEVAELLTHVNFD